MYMPSQMPEVKDLEDLRRYVETEFAAVARSMVEVSAVDLRPIHTVPTRPREGMIVVADGTDWNPGAGKGAYEFKNSLWSKL